MWMQNVQVEVKWRCRMSMSKSDIVYTYCVWKILVNFGKLQRF